VYFVFRFIDLFNDDSQRANEAAACAAEQGAFWPYYYLLMQQRALPRANDLPVEKLESLAQQLDLDMPVFKASLESGKYGAFVRQSDAEARGLGVIGTPTFFINGTKIEGTKTLQEFQIIVDPLLPKSAN
jgi:protein-disulfide isomerase